MNNAKQRSKTLRLTQLALLAAITVLLTLTPLGYLRIGVVEITFLMLPVILGAVILGPVDGMILGAVFGLTSFAQCFGISPFGTIMANVNVFYAFIVCFIPRVLIGLITGIFAKSLKINQNSKTGVNLLKYGAASFIGTLVNTVFYLGLLVLLYSGISAIEDFLGSSVLKAAIVVVLSNGLIELAVCTVLGAFIIQGVTHAKKKMRI